MGNRKNVRHSSIPRGDARLILVNAADYKSKPISLLRQAVKQRPQRARICVLVDHLESETKFCAGKISYPHTDSIEPPRRHGQAVDNCQIIHFPDLNLT